jgi:hypothetical protein
MTDSAAEDQRSMLRDHDRIPPAAPDSQIVVTSHYAHWFLWATSDRFKPEDKPCR